MTHGALRRLLHPLLDGGLPGADAAVVRAHLEECAGCRRELRALEAVEALVARLPAALVPMGAGPEADARLALLARWAVAPAVRSSAPRWRVRALGATLAAASLALAAWLGPLGPAAAQSPAAPSALVMASFVPTTFMAAGFNAPASTPYTWR